MTYPVALNARIGAADRCILGEVLNAESFFSVETQSIVTLHRVRVQANLKGAATDTVLGVLTPGGVWGGRAQIVTPSLELQAGQRVALMLEAPAPGIAHPLATDLAQYLPVADAQGALIFHNGYFYDLHHTPPMEEFALLEVFASITGEAPRLPGGELYRPRPSSSGPSRPRAIAHLSHNPAFAGTVSPAEYLSITGSGFGPFVGTLEFANADDGGATVVSPPNTSDILYWAEDSIVVKIPRRAGTGLVTVNGAFSAPIEIRYAHLEINSSFFGFATPSRQAYHLRNRNGAGGYTFTYNDAFVSDPSVKACFERALTTWRCGTYVNFNLATATTTLHTAAQDGVNLITFDGSLPAGVLGRATTFLSGSTIPGVCQEENTVWWAEEIDIQFAPDPLPGGMTWNFGQGATGGMQYDFESVALHELGHAHGLGHVIGTAKIMHYALANGDDKRSLAADDVAAGADKMAYSTAATCFDPASDNLPMTAVGASSCVLASAGPQLTARQTERGIRLLEWHTGPAWQGGVMAVERAHVSDGEFEALGALPAVAGQQYYADQSPAEAQAYFYRLRLWLPSGEELFSNVEEILMDRAQVSVRKTAKGIELSYWLKDGQLILFAADGRRIASAPLAAGAREAIFPDLPAGLYFFRVENPDAALTGKWLAP